MEQFNSTRFIDKLQDFLVAAGQGTPIENMWYLFTHGGWVVFVIAMIAVLIWGYMNYIQNKYAAAIKWTMLAIDVPHENLQSTKAIEHVFAAMWPFYESINLKEKYIDGKFQQAFSLEIVSIGGYTQYLIRVPQSHKDIVEAGIYAQYPKAEIFEVEDYTERYRNLKFPNDEYDIWGSEFKLKKPSPYPLRTYPEFEDSLTQTFADPMASVLEVFSKINKEEELWMQFVITPIQDDWKKEGYEIIDKIIGAKQERKKGILDSILYPFYYVATLIEELFIYGIGYEPGQTGIGSKNDSNELINKMLYLTPEQKNVIEGITRKISKMAYQTKLRGIYLGPKGKLNKPKGVAAFIGVLQQFSTLDLNAITPVMKTFTKANYFFVDKRVEGKQRRILSNFRNRSQTGGWGKGFVLNIEELASVFHFPVPEAVRESVKTVGAKKEAPPVDLPDLPYEEGQVIKRMEEANQFNKDNQDFFNSNGSTKIEPPVDLPF